jgi:protein CpxP
MTESDTPTPKTATAKRPARCKGRGRFTFFIILIAAAVGVTGFVATKAMSHGPRFGHHMMMGAFDPARAERRAERAAKHFAIEVDATPEQTQKLLDITKSAVRDLLPLRTQMLDGRKQWRALLLAPSVDKEAIEQLRTEQMGTIDRITKRLATGLAEAAGVLSPAQRQALDRRIERFKNVHGFFNRG